MTPEEHRKLDAEVAEKVMGWVVAIESARGNKIQMKAGPTATRFRSCPVNGEWWENRWLTTDLPYYSTDIQSAWQVVEKMADNGTCTLRIGAGLKSGCQFKCFASNQSAKHAPVIVDGRSKDSPAEAICRAALEAVK